MGAGASSGGAAASGGSSRRRLLTAAGAASSSGDAPPPPPQQQQHQQQQQPPAAAPGADDAAAATAEAALGASLDSWQLLRHAVAHAAPRLAIVDCYEPGGAAAANTASYGELHSHVLALAGRLAALGVTKGSRVAVMLRNSGEVCCVLVCALGPCSLLLLSKRAQGHTSWDATPLLLRCSSPPRGPTPHHHTTQHAQVIALHFAAAALRAIIVNVNTNLAPQELAHILADSGAQLVVAAPEFADALAGAAAAAAAVAVPSGAGQAAPATEAAAASELAVRAVVWVQPGQPLQQQLDSAAAASLPRVAAWASHPYPYGTFAGTAAAGVASDAAAFAADEAAAFGGRPEELDHEDGYQMYFTSGTTGRPKGVLLSHRVVVLHALGTILGEPSGVGLHWCWAGAWASVCLLKACQPVSEPHRSLPPLGLTLGVLLHPTTPHTQRCGCTAVMSGATLLPCSTWSTRLASTPSRCWAGVTSSRPCLPRQTCC
jgi:acyl-CoA synthetase (AMP-forming)/AMP-acid ligase II